MKSAWFPMPTWVAGLVLVAVSLMGAAVAVAVDVPCGLDCPADDDVIWSDTISRGTGLSPPAVMVGLVLLLGLGSRIARWPGAAATTVLALAGLVMTYAWFADTGTIDAVRGDHGVAALVMAVALLTAILNVLASSTRDLWRRFGRVPVPASPVTGERQRADRDGER